VSAETSNVSLKATSDGAVALGYAFNEQDGPGAPPTVDILSSGFGSLAGGYAHAGSNDSTTTLQATGNGSFAWGFADDGTLQATGIAAFALGEDVQATANNTFALGSGFTNSTASTFCVGFGAVDFKVSSGGISQTVHTDNVSNPPTDAELDSIFGTPATVGAGFTAYIDDNGGGANFYQIVSDGTNWWHFAGTKAV
jgi:hypothetical protein